MKKVTFFIGNGFDCKNCLKTGYVNFLDWYIYNCEGDSEVIKRFKDEIKRNEGKDPEYGKYGTWSYLEKQMGLYDPGSLDDFLECYDNVYSMIIEYITTQDATKYNQEINAGKNLDDLPVGFKMFLSSFYRFDTESKELAQKFNDYLSEEQFIFNFISLNYTGLINDCVEKMHKTIPLEDSYPESSRIKVKIDKCINPHGVLPNIVFGVSDESQIINPEYLTSEAFRSRMIKKEQAQKYNITDFDLCYNIIFDSDIICLFGVSVGETDNHWWRACCEWLEISTDHFLVIYMHEKDEQKQRIIECETKEKLKKAFNKDYDICSQVLITFDEQSFAERIVDAAASSNISISSFASATLTVEKSPKG